LPQPNASTASNATIPILSLFIDGLPDFEPKGAAGLVPAMGERKTGKNALHDAQTAADFSKAHRDALRQFAVKVTKRSNSYIFPRRTAMAPVKAGAYGASARILLRFSTVDRIESFSDSIICIGGVLP
jgi:hypothetical protein